jgi:hypothetical protein
MLSGYTQSALGVILSRDHKSISAWETGRNQIPSDAANALRKMGYTGPINSDKDKPVRKSGSHLAPVNIGDSSRGDYLSSEDVSDAWAIVHEACIAAGARPDLMSSKGLGRLLAIVAEKISRGDGEAARAALLEEAKDLVSSMTVQGTAQ